MIVDNYNQPWHDAVTLECAIRLLPTYGDHKRVLVICEMFKDWLPIVAIPLVSSTANQRFECRSSEFQSNILPHWLSVPKRIPHVLIKLPAEIYSNK